jgi:hypothetical protein
MQNSPLESSCVVVAFIENYSTSKPLKASPEISQILSCDTVLLGVRYVSVIFIIIFIFAYYCSVVIAVLLLLLFCCYYVLFCCYYVALLLLVLSYVLIVCTVPLPPGVNLVAVDKYIYLRNCQAVTILQHTVQVLLGCPIHNL